jgi:ribosomal protein S18 acetylase RimI-like enzyme
LRAARDEDFAFLVSLRRSTMKGYVEQTWGRWDDAEQRERYRSLFSPSADRIIVLDGNDIGCLSVDDSGDHLFVGFIGILPEYQRAGLGTFLMKQIIIEADRRRIPVRLNVLKVNPARALYERLGFCVVGGDEFRHLMEHSPATESS